MQLDITTGSFHERCPRKAAIIILGQDLLRLETKNTHPEKNQHCNLISRLQGEKRRVKTLEATKTTQNPHKGNNGHSNLTKIQKRKQARYVTTPNLTYICSLTLNPLKSLPNLDDALILPQQQKKRNESLMLSLMQKFTVTCYWLKKN